eukprot:CAMPEP_0173341372 /NCGR_PEP_ID=MMETSP1144-20121109/9533_1 /TAXON_ID=483371 /ORGANISM="non described non described, Strain CCMP2298" /LENGTH=204 /DNA_ID=CAMNT_0014287683 /DNA_START=204 /DNA_END=819 /DNA_ORIENTATION=+
MSLRTLGHPSPPRLFGCLLVPRLAEVRQMRFELQLETVPLQAALHSQEASPAIDLRILPWHAQDLPVELHWVHAALVFDAQPGGYIGGAERDLEALARGDLPHPPEQRLCELLEATPTVTSVVGFFLRLWPVFLIAATTCLVRAAMKLLISAASKSIAGAAGGGALVFLGAVLGTFSSTSDSGLLEPVKHKTSTGCLWVLGIWV